MQGDDPPFLPVGTDVSAKYKGAFCEAKIKKVVRNIKCKVTLKAGGSTTVNDDIIKGTLRVGSTVEVKQDPKKDAVEAIIAKIQDCSQYTVVFDDGDITTLRRSALCLKSGRHFNESETLDQLPLTHPEHFSTPVIAGRRGRRGRAQSEESEGEPSSSRRVKAASEPHVGRVVLVEAGGGGERRRPHQPAFPALVVAPTAQIKVKEDYLVRSFKDGRYYTVPKKEAREFRKGSAPLEWCGVEAALQYLNNGVLPPHWDRDSLFNEPRNTSDDSSDDEPREEKDHFVAQLYKFMDDRGTPLNRNPTIANKDIDLYRLFRVVQKHGGYNRVTNQNQWKLVADKMGFHPVTTSITNLCKQAYKKFLHSFEDFYRKLGVTLVAHPRGARTPPAGRSLIRDRDKHPPTSSSACSTPTGTPTTPTQLQRKDKDSDKSETDKSEKDEKPEKTKEKARGSDGEDSADNQPLAIVTPKPDKDKDKDNKSTTSSSTTSEEKPIIMKPRSASKTRLPPAKTESHDKRTPKRRPLSAKLSGGEGPSTSSSRASRRPHASTDSDSSERASRRIYSLASRCGPTKKLASRRSQSANSASSGNTIASNTAKRPRKRKTTEPTSEPSRPVSNLKAQVGDKLKVYYGPAQSESKVTYEAKVIEVSAEGMLRVHYTGWNTRYDEWIKPQRIALNVSQYEQRNKKGTNISRRVRAKRTEESSTRSDSDSDTDSEVDIKRAPKKDEKPGLKPPSRSKDTKSSDSSGSSKPRKRPVRTVSTPANVSPPKKARPSGHQGRDYDLNEIRSELKGLHSVKTEPEDPKESPEKTRKDDTTPAAVAAAPPPDPPQPEKQPEDVYEFKEPEPFELELHDEKKKRTHRIFDDISPSKYTSTLSKSLSEEISEDPLRPRPSLRSPTLSPFREFAAAREPPGRQSPEDDSKDDMFSMDDDSFQDGTGHFEGFTPAKNQETYSKKNKVSKLRKLIDDSPESPADDEQSSEDESEETIMKEEDGESSSAPPPTESPETPEDIVKDEPKIKEEKEDDDDDDDDDDDEKSTDTEEPTVMQLDIDVSQIPEPPNTPPPESKIELSKITQSILLGEPITTVTCLTDIELPSTSPLADIIAGTNIPDTLEITKDEVKKEEDEELKLLSIPLPTSEPKENPVKLIIDKKLDPDLVITKLEPPSSPLVDTEEDKSEPDSPARNDVLPEPPAGFLLQSEGPKIAEKLLKAINSAKRLSMSPPPNEDRADSPKKDLLKLPKMDDKSSPVASELRATPTGKELKPKSEPKKIIGDAGDSIFGEPSILTDKRDVSEIKKVKPKEPTPTPPRLQSPLNVLERRKSVPELTLATPKNNKVLSDTIQKLSSQINQSAANIPLPPFPAEDRSESSDSDDSDRRLIIDKLAAEEWGNASETRAGTATGTPAGVGPSVGATGATGATAGATTRALHAGKSPGEWSAGETLLMLEDACKNERKHSASVVVAGSGRVGAASATGASSSTATSAGQAAGGAGEEDSSLSLLLCSETIPGSPAPDAEPAPGAPPRQRLHMPFASAPPHHHHKAEERRASASSREGGAGAGAGGGGAGAEERAADAGWPRRHAQLNSSPPTTPDSSLDMSPGHRERRMSERDSPSERKEDEDENRPPEAPHDMEKPHGRVGGVRSRKASESSGFGAGRGRRRRRDTDDTHASHQQHAPQPPPKYNFLVELDDSWDSVMRINVLRTQLAELRKTYHNEKAELAAIDRRRKKLRRKEREAVKAAKAACS